MDKVSTKQIVKLGVPRIPRMLLAAARHSLYLSDTASKWDFRTAMTIELMRSFVRSNDPSMTVTRQQRASMIDVGIKGPMWVSKVVVLSPEDNSLLLSLQRAFAELGDGSETYTTPSLAAVEGEWIGHRQGVSNDAPEPATSPKEKYNALMTEVQSDLVVLYIHGGAFAFMDPCTHRFPASHISKLTGGRCYIPRYRLAPQNPFPSALLDCLVSYLALLYPPPGSLHEPVPASKICFSGDSAGGNLCMSLTLLILTLQKLGNGTAKVSWQGKEVELPLPASVTAISPYADVTRAFPSEEGNAKFDYLPTPSMTVKNQKACAAWPAIPPRQNMYCDDATLRHPLVSSVTAKSWAGSPPMYIVTGQECLTDGDLYVTQKLAADGVPVIFEQYVAMPHVFPFVFPTLNESKRNFRTWREFLKSSIADPAKIVSSGTQIAAGTCKETPLELSSLSPYSAEQVEALMLKSIKALAANGLVANEERPIPAKL